MGKINTYPSVTAFDDGDLILLEKADGTGTKTITYGDLVEALKESAVVDSKSDALAVTDNYVPTGAKAYQTLATEISTLNSKTNEIYSEMLSSTVSFKDTKGTTNTNTAWGVADSIATDPTAHFNKLESFSAGATYTTITSGVSANYYTILLFSYNYSGIFMFTYRNGTYYYYRIGTNTDF